MDVNQWIQKTVRSLLMSSSGSSSVSSLMPGRSHNAPEFESLSDTKDKLETRRKDVLSRSNRRIFLFLTYCNNNKVCVSSVDYYQLKKLST
ncbi:hypothetical protein F2Q69_00016799 [Brassica cretica]|uniref:Uncharacterized protein n=1 Tax=Brassica cretica TaxID=69181 RepID=A0A8S9QSM5_BRACR|nr:hypothetical protein F2Q69_00016799 [Brassica cretica]